MGVAREAPAPPVAWVALAALAARGERRAHATSPSRQSLSSHYDEHSAWPLYAEPHLMVAAPFRSGAQLYRLDAVGTAISAKTVWVGKKLSNDVCSSILVDGHVYGFVRCAKKPFA